MRLLFLAVLFFITSCALQISSPTARMLSPETQGKAGKGSLEARAQGVKRDRFDFQNERTDNSMNSKGADTSVGFLGEMGVIPKLDVFIMPNINATSVLGVKYQFIGSTREEAKRKNFSVAIEAGAGSASQHSTSSSNFFASEHGVGNIKRGYMRDSHSEVGIITGYRWQESLLHYLNGIYTNDYVRGTVTTTSGTLDKVSFKYRQDGLIYSTGLIYYFAKAQVKADFSHFISDWTHTNKQTANTLSGSIGFNW